MCFDSGTSSIRIGTKIFPSPTAVETSHLTFDENIVTHKAIPGISAAIAWMMPRMMPTLSM